MKKAVAVLVVLIFAFRLHAECAAPAGIYAACSSEASTSSSGSSDAFDSRFSSSLLIIGLGIGIGLGIVYFVSKALHSESALAKQIPRPTGIFADTLTYTPVTEPSRIPSALYGVSEWRMNLPAFRW